MHFVYLRKSFVGFLLIFASLSFGLLADEVEDTSIHPKHGIVIFVHGFMRTSNNMSALSASFKKDGWSVDTWSYPSKQKYIEEHASDLVKYLNQVSKEKPTCPISFVTHSMGALIVRCALNQSDCPIEAKIGRAVLIAPPNKGAIFGRKLYRCRLIRKILGDKSGAQLMTTPLNGFDALGDFPMEMPVLIIAGTAGFNPMICGLNDDKVALSETCLKTPHFHEKSFAGHSWICHTPTVIKKTKAFLLMPLP